MSHDHWQTLLAQIQQADLFQGLPVKAMRAFCNQAQTIQLDAGQILLSPEHDNHALFILLEGELLVHLSPSEPLPIATLKAGSCCGELSFLQEEKPCAFVTASQPCNLLKLTQTHLPSLLKSYPQLAINLIDLLSQRLRHSTQALHTSEQNANIDSLTGLYNRRRLENIYERESTRCAYDNLPLNLLILDVDLFKDYNDQHGHIAGDFALMLVADTLRRELRPKDAIARFGGEEFVVLLPELNSRQSTSVGHRLRHSLAKTIEFHCPMGTLPGVTASIGMAQMRQGDSLISLISRADRALYRAKQRGRNQVCRA